jgi:diacylglycerol kinase (ATP)
MKCQLILNPKSDSGKAAGRFERIFALLQQAGVEYHCAFAQTYDSMREASIKANETAYDAVVAVGGDGTINAVMNGFFNEDGTSRSDKRMGVIYTGTSPDFCMSYGVPLDLAKAVDAISIGNTRNIRVGRIELRVSPESAATTTKYFSCCASIGIGAMVAGKANRSRKYLGDTGGTLVAILSSLATYRAREMRLNIPSGELIFPKVTNIFVGRTKYIASGLKVNNEIGDDDDRFYILCIHDLGLLRLPGLLKQLYTGNTTSSPVMEVMNSTGIKISSGKDIIPVEFDGDPAGFTPCSIRAAHSPLRLIIG